MKFSIVNASGVVTSSGSTDGGGSSGKSQLGPFTFWSPQSDLPTTYTNMTIPIVSWNSSSAAQMNAGLKMPSAGYVSALCMLINGPTGGNSISMQFYKNGAATGLIATATGANGVTTSARAPGGAGFSFAIDDVISVYIQAAASGINQSFSAYLELVLI